MGGTKSAASSSDSDNEDDEPTLWTPPKSSNEPYVPVEWPIPKEWARDPDKPSQPNSKRIYDYDDDETEEN